MKLVYTIVLLLFGIFLMTAVHETMHMIQTAREGGQIYQVCFSGFDKEEGYAGWVLTDRDTTETVPNIMGLTTMFLFWIGVVYNHFKVTNTEQYL